MINTPLLPDPELEEQGDRVSRALERYAKRLRSGELCGLIDAPVEAAIKGLTDLVGGDSGALWITDEQRDNLVVAFCSSENSGLVGCSQPLSEGLISLVFASEQPICETNVYADARHSKAIDEMTGNKTDAMVAVPFYLGGVLRGVLSVVRFKVSVEGERGFSLEQFQLVQRGAVTTERLLNLELVKVILGIDL